MSITLTILQNEVTGNLELNNDAVTITRFKVVEHINAAQRTLLRTLPLSEIDNAIKTVRFNLTDDVNAYQWPSDFARRIKIWLDFTNAISVSNHGKVATESKNGEFYKSGNYVPTAGYPKWESIEGGFKVFPLPTSDRTDGGRLRYVQQLPTITSSQDCLLRADLTNLIVFYASSLSCMVDDYNLALAKQYAAMFTEDAKTFYRDNKIPGISK